MRLLLVGAFPYPQHHGSQIYFQEQAIALRSLGAEVTLLTYGSGRELPGVGRAGGLRRGRSRSASDLKSEPESSQVGRRTQEAEIAEYWRALDGFEHLTSAPWSAPTTLRSGPSWAKPLADLGLAMTLRNALASSSRHDAYDAILTHNAEATLVALHLLPRRRPPIIYCAHTLLGKELSAYRKVPKINAFSDDPNPGRRPPVVSRGLDRLGHTIDRSLAKRADGWIALTQSADRVMRHFSSTPGILMPPAVPDPLANAGGPDPRATTDRHGLESKRFFLYSGNLDAYQEIDILAAVARRREAREGKEARTMPLVLASHSDQPIPAWTRSQPGVEFLRVESSAEMQALLASARASLVMRRAEGGFPIKLVNSLAVGTPAIAFHGPEWGLEHERDSLISSPERPVASMAAAIDRLEAQDDLAVRLATGARDLYLRRHRPEPVAEQTLALVEEVCRVHALR